LVLVLGFMGGCRKGEGNAGATMLMGVLPVLDASTSTLYFIEN